ncbi:MAG: glycosyltransferase family A protein [Gammaproteobacteria bacterium]
MPVFNGAKWLAEALDSILTQSFSDFELVICDNASSDETESICRQTAADDPRIRYHRNHANIGVHRNYNRTFELCVGTYFKWASCSDICLDGFFEKCVAVLEARPDVVLAYPKAAMLSSRTGAAADAEGYDDNLNIEDDRPATRFIRYLNGERLNNVMNGVIRAAALRQTALHLRLPGSDISMMAELILRGKFVEIPERLFVRRLDPETTDILMNHSASRSLGYPGRPNNVQRVRLHSYRFVTTLWAPIALSEKLRVWLYLLRRVAWLRGRAVRKLMRVVSTVR